MSLTLSAQHPHTLLHHSPASSTSNAASTAASSAARMASSLPSLFLKHARSSSLDKQAQAQQQQHSSHAQSSVNGHASTSSSNQHPSPHAHAQQPASPTASASLGSFVRNGDVVYDHGPPPAAPLPAVGTRSYTVLKEVGDGSFGTVWLADWHSPLSLPKGSGPPGPSSRPEYRGKRLVALKRMKKAFEGGWDECMKLKELKSLRSIPLHPNIIPLYDAFLLPSSKELYFVFECMEGNLYQLTKSRKGRPLAAGLVADLFRQMLSGLNHIHSAGYFHRDMKPENLLITTTGLADYPPFFPPGSSSSHPRPHEKDVVAVVKIADFGLARETRSRPPYTEYVSTRWYRAPEVLLRSRDYSNPVDMWALGTILSEMVNLKPLFPGQSEVDQVFRICEVMGDPSPDYGHDERGRILGGGNWERGIKMAKSVGFQFPKIQPIKFQALFDGNLVPSQLVDIMQDLMRYDPKARLTTMQCLEHPYFSQVAPRLTAVPVPSVPNHVKQAQQQQQQQAAALAAAQATPKQPSLATLQSATNSPLPDGYHPGSAMPSPRTVPSSHSHQSQYSKPAFDPSSNSANGMPGLPPPHSSASGAYSGTTAAHSAYEGYRHSELHSSASSTAANSPDPAGQLQRDRHMSLANSMMSNDSSGLGGMHLTVSTGSQVGSPAMGYPESVIGDVNMDGGEDHSPSPHMDPQSYASMYQQQPRSVSPAASSVHSFGTQEPAASLPLPHPHGSYSALAGHPHRQGANGYAPSTHSSYYNPSIYSGYSNGSGRRGSAGGASTFYDGSIFEGIAPTRAASILSFPASYGERPPSPKFSQAQLPLPSAGGYARSTHSLPVNPALAALRQSGGYSSHRADSDNYTVDFEREALQRSQNHSTSSLQQPTQQQIPKSESAESIKGKKDGKSGRGWMASVFHSSSDNNSRQVHHHPQQQPLIHPANFPASPSSSSASHIGGSSAASIAPSVSTSLKRSPSERSTHAPEQPPPQPQLPLDPKKAKKEAERLAKEAEKLKREAAQKAARDRARAVMQKRNALAQAADPLHNFGQHQFPTKSTSSTTAAANGRTGANGQQLSDKDRQAREQAILQARKQQAAMMNAKLPQISEDGRMRLGVQQAYSQHQYSPDVRYKARRRDDDDDVHSMSSNETRSERRFSISSHATASTVSTTNTMDSDPGPSRSRANQLLPPVRRTPSVSSFGGQSHQSASSGHSGYARRDLNTSSSNTSSLEHGLVGRFQGLTAAERAVSPDGRASPAVGRSSVSPMQSPSGMPGAPGYYAGHPGAGHQSHAISLPPIQSFDHPPPKEFHFGTTPRTSHSTHSNGSTISGNSQFVSNPAAQQQQQTQQPQGLPFTQEMYQHHLQQQQQQQR